MDISIVIVSWNVKEKLKENLKAIYASQRNVSFEIFVIDNNSSDGSNEMVKKMFPGVRLISNKNNLGFAKACNQGLALASGRYRMLLNPDMKVKEDTLEKMINWLDDNKQASVASCKLINQEGETIKQIRHFPGFFNQLLIILKIPHIFPTVLNKYLQVNFDYSKAAKVDSVRGAFFVIRANDFEEIKLDERYFLWFEEVDFCRQARKDGKEVWYTPQATCLDYIGQSFSQVKSLKTQKYFFDSMLKYFKKWQPRWQYVVLRIFSFPIIFLTFLVKDLLGLKTKLRT
jgi:GT2 family glycosyltransferase